MAEISEVSSDLVCYICESPFITSSNSFILYKCKMCNEKTAYCLNCSKITKKLLGNALFRCSICNNIVKAYCKEEISKHSQNDFNNNDKDYSPFKSQNIQINNIMKSPLMPNSSNRNIFYSNSSMQNPRYDYYYQSTKSSFYPPRKLNVKNSVVWRNLNDYQKNDLIAAVRGDRRRRAAVFAVSGDGRGSRRPCIA